MADQPTCGAGLDYHAALPAALGQLTSAVADVLESHMSALDLSDPAAKHEHASYEQLVQEHRTTAAQLDSTAARMHACRDLPSGSHDAAALRHPRTVQAFEGFVQRERELLTLLQNRLEEDQMLLTAMAEWSASSE